MARKTIDVFEAANVEVVVINAAGCGSTLKEYGHLLRDDPAYAERAIQFSAKCKDISEVLATLSPRAERKPLALKVAYHDACHLQHAQRIRNEPRQVLLAIPGLEIVEIPEAAMCCGSAGIYNLVEPVAAQELGDRKVNHILTTNAQAIVSSNPGCLLQILSGLERAGKAIPALHMIELIDASIRGTLPDALQ
jgi:glycolate oxidase iron-sulfur subunit